MESVSVPSILAVSFLIILWWRAVWSLLDMIFHHLANGKKMWLIAFDLASVALILTLVLAHPILGESFR
jgi:hypothetical protein